jgi:hypothetical protein
MTLFGYRASKGFSPELALRDLGGDYVEFDELLASGGEVALEEDSGHLVLMESDEPL